MTSSAFLSPHHPQALSCHQDVCGLGSSPSLWPSAAHDAPGPGPYLQRSVYGLRPGSTLSPPQQLWPVSLALPAWRGLWSEALGWGGGWRSEGGFFFFSFRNQGFRLRLACSSQTDLSKHSSATGRMSSSTSQLLSLLLPSGGGWLMGTQSTCSGYYYSVMKPDPGRGTPQFDERD